MRPVAAGGGAVEDVDPVILADLVGPLHLPGHGVAEEIELGEATGGAVPDHFLDQELTGRVLVVELGEGQFRHHVAPAVGQTKVHRDRLAVAFERVDGEIAVAGGSQGERPEIGNGLGIGEDRCPVPPLPATVLDLEELLKDGGVKMVIPLELDRAGLFEVAHAAAQVGAELRARGGDDGLVASRHSWNWHEWAASGRATADRVAGCLGQIRHLPAGAIFRKVDQLDHIPVAPAPQGIPGRTSNRVIVGNRADEIERVRGVPEHRRTQEPGRHAIEPGPLAQQGQQPDRLTLPVDGESLERCVRLEYLEVGEDPLGAEEGCAAGRDGKLRPRQRFVPCDRDRHDRNRCHVARASVRPGRDDRCGSLAGQRQIHLANLMRLRRDIEADSTAGYSPEMTQEDGFVLSSIRNASPNFPSPSVSGNRY